MAGNDIDDAVTYNPKTPQKSYIVTVGDERVILDGPKLRDAAEAIGAQAGDVLSVGMYRGGNGKLTPLYDTVRVERQA